MHCHSHVAEAQKLWEYSEGLKFIQDLKAGKSLAEVIKQFDLAKAFAKKPEGLGCSDGRICEHRLGGAGNFILAPGTEQAEFVKNNKGEITEVKSHDGCGAAGIKFKQMQDAGEVLPPGVSSADDLGRYYSRDLAKKLEAEYGHTGAAKMSGAVHDERAVYLDGTGRFNPGALPELPAGFICSGPALGLSADYCEREMVTLAKIALGDHGFGNRIDNNSPLYIVVSATNQEQLDQLIKIAEQAAGQFDGRIKVVGFIVE